MIAKGADEPSDDLRGAAFHEAGHVIVAGYLGLSVGEIEIGMGGDDASGRAEIGCADALPFIDQLALCAAGMVAQAIFNAPTHDLAGFGDAVKMHNLLDGVPEMESLSLRNAAYVRAREILEIHKAEVEQLAFKFFATEQIKFDPKFDPMVQK